MLSIELEHFESAPKIYYFFLAGALEVGSARWVFQNDYDLIKVATGYRSIEIFTEKTMDGSRSLMLGNG